MHMPLDSDYQGSIVGPAAVLWSGYGASVGSHPGVYKENINIDWNQLGHC